MTTILLIIHLLIAIALVIVVLLQRSEGGGLGIGGGGGGGGNAGLSGFLSGRSTANVLTRTTAILAGSFMVTSLALTILAGGGPEQPRSILDTVPESESSAPAAPAAPAPETGGQPTVPVE